VDGEERPLTSYQFELLYTLATHAGRVMSRDALMEQVRGEELDAFDRSIDVHVLRIRAAIEDDPRHPRRIITVRGAQGTVLAAVGEPLPAPPPHWTRSGWLQGGGTCFEVELRSPSGVERWRGRGVEE
jgi:hypothetical protein